MSSITVTAAPRRVLADVVPRTLTAETLLVLGATALMGLLAQISIPLGFTPVPLTGQTFGVMFIGSALGWRRAGLSMSLYVLAGSLGVPWFAGHASGESMATFGYLVGMVVAGPVLGWLAERGQSRRVSRAAASMIVGDAIVFAIGVPWLAAAIHVSLPTAITLGLAPFVWGELIKIAAAGVALPTTWRLVDRATR